MLVWLRLAYAARQNQYMLLCACQDKVKRSSHLILTGTQLTFNHFHTVFERSKYLSFYVTMNVSYTYPLRLHGALNFTSRPIAGSLGCLISILECHAEQVLHEWFYKVFLQTGSKGAGNVTE